MATEKIITDYIHLPAYALKATEWEITVSWCFDYHCSNAENIIIGNLALFVTEEEKKKKT